MNLEKIRKQIRKSGLRVQKDGTSDFFFFFKGKTIVSTTEVVRQIRRMTDLSVEDFGLIVGVSPRTIEGWEQDRAISWVARVAIACRFFNK